jgi:photosystem II stability/assembly factor-like uncharacterized protein
MDSRTLSLRLTFLVLLAIPGNALSQQSGGPWAFLSEGPVTRTRHDDITFSDASHGWVVNLDGQIWKTTDGGDTWLKTVDTGFDHRYRSVAFSDSLNGWAGSLFDSSSVLFETSDGGITWTNITSKLPEPRPVGICGMWAVNSSVIYGVGAFFGEPRVVKTSDGGLTWSTIDLSSQIASLVDVYFKDELEGFVIGGSQLGEGSQSIILRTTDGGVTWNEVHRSIPDSGVNGEWGWKISFPSESIGYVAVEFLSNNENGPARIHKTIDGGLTWTEVAVTGSRDHAGLQSVGFVNDLTGWASGRGTTSVTVDGGQTWKQLDSFEPLRPEGQLDGSVNRFFVLSDTLAYAVGERVYKFTGGAVPTGIARAAEQPSSFRIEQNYPNPFGTSTRIGYTLYRPVSVRIVVFDALGRRVRTLVDAFQPAGSHILSWDGRDESGHQLANGSYFYLMDIGESLEMKQMILLR